jgi:hypothetical protein
MDAEQNAPCQWWNVLTRSGLRTLRGALVRCLITTRNQDHELRQFGRASHCSALCHQVGLEDQTGAVPLCQLLVAATIPTPQRGNRAYKRVLWIVLAINAVMFLVEISAGVGAGSASLQADAFDFLGDAGNYIIRLAVVAMALRYRAMAALAKGLTIGAFGLYCLKATRPNRRCCDRAWRSKWPVERRQRLGVGRHRAGLAS